MRITKTLTNQQKLLFIRGIEQIIGRNRLTLRRWWSVGKFPQPIKLNGTNLVWRAEVIHQWIEQTYIPRPTMRLF